MSSTKNPHNCKEMRKLRATLIKHGFVIEDNEKSKWKVWKDDGPFRIIHPGRKAYHQTVRWVRDEYGIDIDPKPVKNKVRRANRTTFQLSKRPSQAGPWDRPWIEFHKWERRFIRCLWAKINEISSSMIGDATVEGLEDYDIGISSDDLIRFIPEWGDPHLTRTNGNSPGREYRKRYGSAKMDEIARYVIETFQQSFRGDSSE